ncbi:MAG: alpha/beta hydrolase [Anaerolineaceae bacterium]|nr:alpha/beta hydrolase [Anaerolineaceae bacterium]
MASILTNQGLLHYEAIGRGKPIIFLHGWLGSYRIWRESLLHFSQHYRTYTIDFWGFGHSGERDDEQPDRETYRVDNFVEMVYDFMDRLGIQSAPLVGHSMGGTVSLKFALAHPEKTESVTVIGSPIDGNSLAWLLKLAGRPLHAKLLFSVFGGFRWFMKHYYSRRISSDPEFPTIMDQDLQQLFLESFLWSISDLRQVRLTDQIHSLSMPVLGMYGKKDIIVDPREWQTLLKGLSTAKIEIFENAGHFIMLDQPEHFQRALGEFLRSTQA